MIKVDGLSKCFGEVIALQDISLELLPGTITAIHGPSGSGKTTLLRLIAGLEAPTTGTIHIGGALVSTPAALTAPHHRGVGFVFQEAALWPHMTVYQNVAFGLLGLPRHEVKARVAEMLAQLGIDDLTRRYPGELSGGQARRVSLARTLVTHPPRLLLDEPLTHIHHEMRSEILNLIEQLAVNRGTMVVYVTHELAEAARLGGRLIRMEEGAIVWADACPAGEIPASDTPNRESFRAH